MVVDGDPCRRRWQRTEVGRSASLAIGSSGDLVLEDEGVKAALSPAWTVTRKGGGG
jgi:hypothetical protein